MDARKRAYDGNPGAADRGPGSPQRGPRDASVAGWPSRGRADREILRRASDGAARLGRPHFVSAPDEAATETAADPEQRQEDVTQDKGRGRSKAQMPAGGAGERGFGAIPHG